MCATSPCDRGSSPAAGLGYAVAPAKLGVEPTGESYCRRRRVPRFSTRREAKSSP